MSIVTDWAVLLTTSKLKGLFVGYWLLSRIKSIDVGKSPFSNGLSYTIVTESSVNNWIHWLCLVWMDFIEYLSCTEEIENVSILSATSTISIV